MRMAIRSFQSTRSRSPERHLNPRSRPTGRRSIRASRGSVSWRRRSKRLGWVRQSANGPKLCSNSKVLVHDSRLRLEIMRGPLEYRLAFDQNHHAVDYRRDFRDTLVDQQCCDTAVARKSDGLPDFIADERGEALGRLIENEDARIGQKRARDRQ